MAPGPTTRIGVLLIDAVQLLDLSPIDIFAMLSEGYISTLSQMPAPLKAGAVPMEIVYINQAGPDTLHGCTANVNLRVHASISDKICAPPAEEGEERTLDILLIPGPDPWAYEPNDALNRFIKGHFDSGTDVLTVCTGVYPAAHAGLLKGRKATGPRMLIPELKKKFPEAIWKDKRWTSDGNLWASGTSTLSILRHAPRGITAYVRLVSKAGITNGQDMVAAYIREKWPGPTAEAILAMADVGDRPQEYGSSRVSNNVWWLWTVVRAWAFPYKR